MDYPTVVLSAFGGRLTSPPFAIEPQRINGYRMPLMVSPNLSFTWADLDGASLPAVGPTFTEATFRWQGRRNQHGDYVLELDPSVFRPVEIKTKIVEERITLWQHIKRVVKERFS